MAQKFSSWRLNVLIIGLTIVLTDAVVVAVELLMYGQILAHTLPVATFSGLIVAALVVRATSFVHTRVAMNDRRRLEADIAHAQGNLAMAAETTQMVFWELHLPGGALEFIQGNLSWLGLAANVKTNSLQAWLTLMHPDDVAPFMQRFQETMQPGSPDFEMEYRLQIEHGSWAWVHTRGHIKQRDAQGVAQVAVGGSINITPRKHTEEARQEQEFLFSEAQRVGQIGSYVLNLTTDTWTSSTMLDQLCGLEPDIEKKIASWTALVHPDDRAMMLDYFLLNVIEARQPFNREYRIVRVTDGATRWMWGRGELSLNSAGIPVKMIGTIQDITERKRTEDSLRENERILRAAIEILDEAFVLFDPQDRLVFCNEKYKKLYAASADVIVPGASFEHIIRTGAERGEYADATGRVDAWVTERMAAHRASSDPVIQRLETGRSLRILEQHTTDGYTVGFRVDITALVQATKAAESSTRQLQNVLNAASDVAVIATNMDGLIQVFNRGAEQLFGYDSGEMVGKQTPSILHLDQEVAQRAQELSAELGQAVAGFDVFTLKARAQGQEHREWTYVHKDGRHLLVSLVVTAVHASDGEITGYLGVAQDITQRKVAENRLQLAASVFTHAREGITITDASGTIIEVNDMFTQITGYSRDEVLGQNPRILQSGRQGKTFYAALWQNLITQGYWSGEVWNRRKNGEVYAEILTISAVRDPQGTTLHYVALFSDITAIKTHQSELEHIAHFDTLTGLPNRLLLGDRLHQAIAQSQRRDQSLAVVYLDLDNIKAVNDTYGHDAGDAVLIAASEAMQAALRDGDTLARMGGDEFVAVLVDLDQTRDCLPVIERLLQAAATAVKIPASTEDADGEPDQSVQVSASIGVTFYPQDDVDADVLLRHADQAMYLAKQAGKNRYHVFNIAHDAAIQNRHEELKRISEALNQGEFVLYYQPKVNMRTGLVIGAEALIRWQHPERGLLHPGVFLPIIEDHPISIDLGEWVINTALAQMSSWHAEGLDLVVSVNIGALQLQQEDFPERLQGILAAHPDVTPRCLQLEILETSTLEDITKVTIVMRACHAIGVAFALDDFGTGYSSLTYLKHLPAEVLKIDQSFIRNMTDSPDDLAIVKGVIGLAQVFHREVIAEGVETEALGNLLLDVGCHLAQGYGVARPMPAQNMPGWAAKWQAGAVWTA